MVLKVEADMNAMFVQKSRNGHAFLDAVFSLMILCLLVLSVSAFLRKAGTSLAAGKEKVRLIIGEISSDE